MHASFVDTSSHYLVVSKIQRYGDVPPFELDSNQGSKGANLQAAFNYVFSSHCQFLDLSSTLGLHSVPKDFFVRGFNFNSMDDSISTHTDAKVAPGIREGPAKIYTHHSHPMHSVLLRSAHFINDKRPADKCCSRL